MDHLSKVHPAQYGPMVANLTLLGLLDAQLVRNETQALRVVTAKSIFVLFLGLRRLLNWVQ